MRILLTGATGKLGNAVARKLVERGDQVVALARNPTAAAELLPEASRSVEIVPGDVTDLASVRRAARGTDAAINCMGIFEQWQRHPEIFNRVNAEGAANVARAAAAAGARRLVHTSTYDVFDAPAGGTVSEAALADYEKRTPYERSKQLAERLLLGEAGEGLEVVITNPAGLYGPGRWAAAGWDGAIRDAIRGRLPAVPPGGLSLLGVESAAGAHLAALDRGRPGERYLLADGYAEVREIIEVAVAAAGRGRVPWQLPLNLARGLARAGEALAEATGLPPLVSRGQLHFLQWEARADTTKAQAELGFKPREWRQGIARTVAWMEREGRI